MTHMNAELWAEIRRSHLIEKVPIAEIARRLHLDRKTVRRALRSDRVPVVARVRSMVLNKAINRMMRNGSVNWWFTRSNIQSPRISVSGLPGKDTSRNSSSALQSA